MSDSGTPWTAACQASLSFTISLSLLTFMSTELVMLSNHLILYCPILLPLIFPSIRVFSNESGGQGIRVSASASVLPMNIQGPLRQGRPQVPCSRLSLLRPELNPSRSRTLSPVHLRELFTLSGGLPGGLRPPCPRGLFTS